MGKLTYHFRKLVQNLIFPGMRRSVRDLQAGLAKTRSQLEQATVDLKRTRLEIESCHSALTKLQTDVDHRQQELAAKLGEMAAHLSDLEIAMPNRLDGSDSSRMAQDVDRLFNLGKHVEALQRINEALVCDPAPVNLWYRKVIILIEMGEMDRAKDAILRARRKHPLHPLLHSLGETVGYREAQSTEGPLLKGPVLL